MNSEVKISGDRVQLTRVFAAPREQVFRWWTKPELLGQWSGCNDTTQVTVEMDFRVCGSFVQKLNITGVGEYTITGTYDEIVEPELIVYHVNLGPATTRVAVEFIEQGGETKVIWTQTGFPDEKLSRIVSEGTMESLNRLEGLLAAAT